MKNKLQFVLDKLNGMPTLNLLGLLVLLITGIGYYLMMIASGVIYIFGTLYVMYLLLRRLFNT